VGSRRDDEVHGSGWLAMRQVDSKNGEYELGRGEGRGCGILVCLDIRCQPGSNLFKAEDKFTGSLVDAKHRYASAGTPCRDLGSIFDQLGQSLCFIPSSVVAG